MVYQTNFSLATETSNVNHLIQLWSIPGGYKLWPVCKFQPITHFCSAHNTLWFSQNNELFLQNMCPWFDDREH